MFRFATLLVAVLFAVPCAAQTPIPSEVPLPGPEFQTSAPSGPTIQIEAEDLSVDTKGKIRIKTPTGEVVIDPTAQPQVIVIPGQGPTDLLLPNVPKDAAGRPLFQVPGSYRPYYPVGQFSNRPPEHLNRLSAFFSSASGGFGFRLNFDRRLSPRLRLTAGPEMLTYGLLKSLDLLGEDMPENTTRITLLALPLGLQRQFTPKSRVVPHVGFGAGPLLRFDHRPTLAGSSPFGYGGSIRTSVGYPYNALQVGLPLDDFPQTSLTLGGFVSSGLNIRFGEQKDLALTVEGRYPLARFTDTLGSPGDFSGLSLAVGFGKYF